MLGALRGASSPDIDETHWAALGQRLATEKGVERYHTAVAYARKQNESELAYRDWLARVVAGFQRHHAEVFGTLDTPAGPLPALNQRLMVMAFSQYHKVFKQPPSQDHQQQIVSAVLEALNTHYWFDVALDAWLWRTTHRVVVTDLRDVIRHNTLEFDQVEPFTFAGDSIDDVLLTDAFLSAIQDVANQRYRVVLLLLCLYQLSNAELAVFFGVPVPRAAVWLSRARAAFRQVYQRQQRGDSDALTEF